MKGLLDGGSIATDMAHEAFLVVVQGVDVGLQLVGFPEAHPAYLAQVRPDTEVHLPDVGAQRPGTNRREGCLTNN